MTLKSIINRILAGPRLNTMYIYNLKYNNSNGKFGDIEGVSYEILNRNTCKQVSKIREQNVEKTFTTICDKQLVILAKCEGKVAGHAALKLPDDLYLGKRWKDMAYIHYCFVDPKFRGKNIYPFMLATLSELGYQKYGFDIVYGSADKKNISSQRGIAKVGYERVGSCLELSWGGITLLRMYRRVKR